MAQDKLNTLLQVLLLSLQPNDKEWLIAQMQEDLEKEKQKNNALLRCSLDISLQQIKDGDVISDEQAEDMMNRFVNSDVRVAV